MDRVNQHAAEEVVHFEGNEVEVEIDTTFDHKRRSLIRHFRWAYDKELAYWPRAFQEIKRKCYSIGRLL